MVANYKEHGFKITAERLPDTCTACPFWVVNTRTLEGGCYITGKEIEIDGQQDEKRMDNCPIERSGTMVDSKVNYNEKGVCTNAPDGYDIDGCPYQKKGCKLQCKKKKGQYTWNTREDGEDWDNDRFDTIEECLQDAWQNDVEPGTMIVIGIREDYEPIINVDDVLERVGEDAYEEVGEVAEDWPAFVSRKGYYGAEELEKELNRVFQEWLVKTNQVPDFYKIYPLEDLYEVGDYS